MDESIPETQPDGAFAPPPGVPPTSRATAEPDEPHRPQRMLPLLRRDSQSLINRALDKLDSFADDIATRAGLR